jgi:hypothetical protein
MPTKTTDETGREILLYDDGTQKDAKTGRFIRGPVDNPIVRDPVGMNRLRNAKSKTDARDAIDEEIYPLDPSKWGTGEGWKEVIKKCVSLIMQSKNARGVAELVGKIGSAAGYLSPRGDGETVQIERGIHATPAQLQALLEMLDEEITRRVERRSAIEGETHE